MVESERTNAVGFSRVGQRESPGDSSIDRSALASRSGGWRTAVDAAKWRTAKESNIHRELTPRTSGRKGSTNLRVEMRIDSRTSPGSRLSSQKGAG